MSPGPGAGERCVSPKETGDKPGDRERCQSLLLHFAVRFSGHGMAWEEGLVETARL